jgi:hypothetical protein
MLTQWSTYLTGGLLLAIHFIWDSFFPPVPIWGKACIAVVGPIIAAYYVWREQYDRAGQLRQRLIPKLEIACVPVHDGACYRVRVKNCSDTTVMFAARLEYIEPVIDHALPVHLQITHQAGQQAAIPAHESALVDVFVDNPFLMLDQENVFVGETIGFLFFGHPPAQVDVARQRYLIRICAYPVQPENGKAAIRSFHIIPRFQDSCIFGDAGVPYQEPV